MANRPTSSPLQRAADVATLSIANVAIACSNPRAVRRYHYLNKRIPRLAVPETYGEQMLWRKLVDRNPLHITLCDKIACKELVRQRCPELEVPETLWIGDDADRIPDAVLEGDVFVKTSHGYNHNYRISSGNVDRLDLKQRTDTWLATTHGLEDCEWAYRKVPPRLFVERAIGDARDDLIEFFVRASDGVPLLGSLVGRNKLPDMWVISLTAEGVPCPGAEDPEGAVPEPIPAGLDILEPYREAVARAAALSKGIDYARFDFLWNGETLYGGEVTVYPSRGIGEVDNPLVRQLLNGWRLHGSGFLSSPQQGLRGVYASALRRALEQR